LQTESDTPKYHLELPPEAKPARDFIEAFVARYESQIDELEQQVQSLSKQVQSLTEKLQRRCNDALRNSIALDLHDFDRDLGQQIDCCMVFQ
jgi:uncharacterized coiled-coil DUF342 family protein